jgi:tetratricopeptide (TPR) repeat protein
LFLINTNGSHAIINIRKKGFLISLISIMAFFAFFFKANINFALEKKQLDNLTILLNENKFKQALEYIKDIDIYKSKNSLLVSTCGLVYERNAIDTTKQNYSLLKSKSKHNNLNLMFNSKNCYIRAIELNPYEDIFYHNIAWLYFYEENVDSALININRAVNLSSNSSLHYITKGLFLENINPSQAFDSYKEAIKLSPDVIDSPFFQELKRSKVINLKTLIQIAINELENYQNSKYSTIIQAKIGKLLLSSEKIDAAWNTFQKVLNELPNLNRPWLYLGNIYDAQGKGIEMLECYNKSVFLDFHDYLPRKQLAKYYWSKDDTIKARYNEELSLKYFRNYSTESSNKSMRKYFQRVAKDDLIPLGLNQYITPSLKDNN